jgi:hypothetical protein
MILYASITGMDRLVCMSRALTSVEVEDVISSIRRLVSEELRIPAGNAQLAHPGVLLLRPEQRVAWNMARWRVTMRH